MSSLDNVRYLPTTAAQRIAELDQKLELATFAAETNARTVASQMLKMREYEAKIKEQADKIAFLSENSNVAAVIRENATDLLTAAIQAADDIRIPVSVKVYRCAVLGHKAHSPAYCHEQKPKLVMVDEEWSLRDIFGDFDAMPAREQAALLISFAFGERPLVVRCEECGERNAECVCEK
jgi:hypothetical protein